SAFLSSKEISAWDGSIVGVGVSIGVGVGLRVGVGVGVGVGLRVGFGVAVGFADVTEVGTSSLTSVVSDDF
ncbi:MAG TPA: hypothetical protein PKK43_14595, partial [Spirochaetota bacterium]|nr:hypothetical protein [Spirochaetota bacterium]